MAYTSSLAAPRSLDVPRARSAMSPGPATVRWRTASGLTLAGDIRGDDEAPPVLLLHGGGQTRHAWGGAAAALAAAGWRAVTLDFRGHGDSDWSPDGDYSIEAMRQDVSDVVAALGVPTVLVGASMGGLVSLDLAGSDDRGVVRALVLVDVTPRIEPAGAQRIVDFMRSRPDGFADLEEAVEAVAAYATHRSRPPDGRGLEKNLRRGADGRLRWHWDPRFLDHIDAPDALRRPVEPGGLLLAARRVQAPTLLVRGHLSDVVSEKGVDEFLAAVPHAAFVDVRGAGHMVAGDRNDRFSGAVLDFLATLRE